MATYALPEAYGVGQVGKDITGGMFCMTATLEIGTTSIINTANGTSAATTPSAADVVRMITIPNGVTVLDGFAVYDAITATDVDIGYGSNTDYFMDGTNMSSAGKTYFTNEEAFPLTFSSEDTIDVLFNTTGPSAGTLTVVVYCTSDTVDLT